ncbi:MAG: ATP-binding cassette domain-containing protein [Acidimicrobiales bacterium]
MTELAIACRNVEVEYLIRGRQSTVRDRLRGSVSAGRTIKAVRGVNLDVTVGESVGIIGPNGSGKSTLLRTIAGLLPPTRGDVLVRSMPTLLGVSAVLRPRMTGRRNIQIGLLAQGIRGVQIPELEKEVIEFSELDEFIDYPMDTYSSGMRARLHFSIATAVTPEILLIDEALAVGDRQFREKSARRFDLHKKSAGTIVIVSHVLGELRRSCDRVIWLEKGEIITDGPTDEVLDLYEST